MSYEVKEPVIQFYASLENNNSHIKGQNHKRGQNCSEVKKVI